MRLIDADKLMQFCSVMVANCGDNGKGLWEQFRTTILRSSTVDAELKWIPVSERLPEENTNVLISYRYREGEGDTSNTYIDIASYGQRYFEPFEYLEDNYVVIAWMPLPKAYEVTE